MGPRAAVGEPNFPGSKWLVDGVAPEPGSIIFQLPRGSRRRRTRALDGDAAMSGHEQLEIPAAGDVTPTSQHSRATETG